MKKIIAISGKQYSGKDTLCEILLKKLPNFSRIGLGDAIKLEYSKLKNIPYDEILKNKHLYRKDLIELGNWGRSQSQDYWLKKIVDLDNIIIPDIRVEYEADFLRENHAYLIRVNSSYLNRSKRGIIVSADDLTETALDSYTHWSFAVDNNSDIEHLVQQADKIIDNFHHFIGHNLSPRT